MYVVVLSWPDDPDRGIEPYGPFADDKEADQWIADCQEAADMGWQLLRGANYLMTPLTRFDPTDLWEGGSGAASSAGVR